MKCGWRAGRGMSPAVIYWLLALLLFKSCNRTFSLLLQTELSNISLSLEAASFEDAARRCLNDTALAGPGVLTPATLLLYVLQDIISKNTAQLQNSVRQDPPIYNTGGSSLWVMDPWGSCRAIILPARLSSYTGAVELSLVPCSWNLHFMCMEYSVALSLSAGLTLPHNIYRTPTSPPLPVGVPSSGSTTTSIVPPGYRLVRSGVTLGYPALPAGATPFSGRLHYQQLGPVVNIVGRWRTSGLDALRLVHANDATNIVEQAMAFGTVTDFVGSPAVSTPQTIVWAATPLPREDASAGWLRTSYITRVEGCSSNTAVQRIVLVNAGGAAAAQGVTRCISNYAEEVAPGGFLAFLEGYFVNTANSSVDVGSSTSIVQLWFVWAVPESYVDADSSGVASYPAAPTASDASALPSLVYGTGGVRAIAPRLTPPEPVPQCTQGRRMIPPEIAIRNRAECGQSSLEHFACPSYMCCGTTRGRVGICGMAASACLLSACDPRFGLCGVIPNEALEVTPHEGLLGVAPAPSPLSSAPPYTTDFGGDTGNMGTATVRYGASVYVLDKSATVTYSAAVEGCRALALYGLSWRLIMLADAFSYEVTLLGRSTFLAMLDNRLAWVQPRPDDSNLGAPGCLTVTWDVDVSSVQLVAVQAAECNSIASVICKARWPSLGSSNGSSAFHAKSPPLPAVPNTPKWAPGIHALSSSLVGLGQPNSGPLCTFESFGGWQAFVEVNQTMSQVGSSQTQSSASAVAVPLGLNVTLDTPLASIAIRPLVTWSAVSSELAAAYQVVGSIAVQYLTNTGSGAVWAPPIILGSLDGTYLSDNASFGAEALTNPAGVTPYISASAGWDALELDVANGEVVVEVVGCRGALIEQMLFRTSTGRLWTTPIGSALTCSVPFNRRPPAGGYLVALQVFGGSFVEEIKLLWGTPTNPQSGPGYPVIAPRDFPPSPVLPPAPPVADAQTNAAPAGSNISRSTKHQSPAVLSIGVSFAVLVPVLASAVLVWWMCRQRDRHLRRRRRKKSDRATPHAAAASIAGEDGVGGVEHNGKGDMRTCLGFLSVFVDGSCNPPLAQPKAAGIPSVEDASRLGVAPRICESSAGASPSSTAPTVSSACGINLTAPVTTLNVAPLSSAAIMYGDDIVPGLAAEAPASGAAGGKNGGNACTYSSTADLQHDGASTPKASPQNCGASFGSVALQLTSSSATLLDINCGVVGDVVSGNRIARCDVDSRSIRECAVPAPPPPPSTCWARTHTSAGNHDDDDVVAGEAAAETATNAPSEVATEAAPAWTAASALQTSRAMAHLVPGQHMPPVGPDAWTQNLHSALFYKVLYQWKPSFLASPLLTSSLVPGAGVPTPVPPSPPMGITLVSSQPHRQAATATAVGTTAPGTAPSPATTSIAPSSPVAPSSLIVAPLTTSGGGGGGSAGSAISYHSAGQLLAAAPPYMAKLLATAATSRSQMTDGASSGLSQRASAHAGPPLCAVAMCSTNTSGIANVGGLAGGMVAAAMGTGASGSKSGPRSVSDSREAPLGPSGLEGLNATDMEMAAAAVESGSSALASPVTDAVLGKLDENTDLVLGRDVLVDTDDPSSYLGHGTSGVVRRGLLSQADGSWRPVAVKLFNPPSDQAIDAYRRHQKTLLQEITILGSLRHPNIVQLLGGSMSLQPGASFLVEELCGRTLSHAIYDASTPYDLRQVLRWCCDIARGLAYLHPNIMHRDLKPSNVLLDQHGTAKISDFGLARFKIHTTLVTRDAEVGTTCYMSPECFVSNDFKVTAACDVYSLGVMINEMVTRQLPWSGVRTAVVGFKVAVVGDRPRLPEDGCQLCPTGLRDLIRACWAQRPEDRPSSAEVLRRLQLLLAEAGEPGKGNDGYFPRIEEG